MSGKGSIALYINDPEVSNELEYLNWSLEQQKFKPLEGLATFHLKLDLSI